MCVNAPSPDNNTEDSWANQSDNDLVVEQAEAGNNVATPLLRKILLQDTAATTSCISQKCETNN